MGAQLPLQKIQFVLDAGAAPFTNDKGPYDLASKNADQDTAHADHRRTRPKAHDDPR